MHTHTHTQTCTHIHAHMHTCTHTCTHAHTRTHTQTTHLHPRQVNRVQDSPERGLGLRHRQRVHVLRAHNRLHAARHAIDGHAIVRSINAYVGRATDQTTSAGAMRALATTRRWQSIKTSHACSRTAIARPLRAAPGHSTIVSCSVNYPSFKQQTRGTSIAVKHR
jgi:hypothetical protein